MITGMRYWVSGCTSVCVRTGIVFCAYSVIVPRLLEDLQSPIYSWSVHLVKAEDVQIIHGVQESTLFHMVKQLAIQLRNRTVYVLPHPLDSLIVCRASSDYATSIETTMM